MTHGTSASIKCPYCKGNISLPTEGKSIHQNGPTVEYARACQRCHQPVYFWASWEIVVHAEKEGKVK